MSAKLDQQEDWGADSEPSRSSPGPSWEGAEILEVSQGYNSAGNKEHGPWVRAWRDHLCEIQAMAPLALPTVLMDVFVNVKCS